MGSFPENFVPHEGMRLSEIPEVNHDDVAGSVRTALVLVQGDTTRSISLKPGYTAYPLAGSYEEVNAGDILWKWQNMMAKGAAYDGVYQTQVGGRAVYHFWNNTVNDQCKVAMHKVTTDFPITITQDEALWMAQATGLDLTREACWTSKFEGDSFHYRFKFNTSQGHMFDVYLERMEKFYAGDSDNITQQRYNELKAAMVSLRPPDEFSLGFKIFTSSVVVSSAIVGGAALLWNYLTGGGGAGGSGGGTQVIVMTEAQLAALGQGAINAEQFGQGVTTEAILLLTTASGMASTAYDTVGGIMSSWGHWMIDEHPLITIGGATVIGLGLVITGGLETGILVWDDATGIGVADDVALPLTTGQMATGVVLLGVAGGLAKSYYDSMLTEEESPEKL